MQRKLLNFHIFVTTFSSGDMVSESSPNKKRLVLQWCSFYKHNFSVIEKVAVQTPLLCFNHLSYIVATDTVL